MASCCFAQRRAIETYRAAIGNKRCCIHTYPFSSCADPAQCDIPCGSEILVDRNTAGYFCRRDTNSVVKSDPTLNLDGSARSDRTALGFGNQIHTRSRCCGAVGDSSEGDGSL